MIKDWIETKLWRYVLRKLMKVPMFVGVYDARNGSSQFMNGVGTVMEYISYKARDAGFEKEWLDNIIESKRKTGGLHE